MGVVNVTPDSFSDGGRFASTERAVEHGLFLLESGADILDIGGESTRPGSPAGTAHAIAAEVEQARVLPVVEALRRARPDVLLSVDTYRASTARLCVRAGAVIVNDVSGLLWDEAMAPTCAELGCGVVVMDTHGRPSEWKVQPSASSPQEVVRRLAERVGAAQQAGIARECIVADPGLGFGKSAAESWALLANWDALLQLGLPLLAGASRKGFLVQRPEAEQSGRLAGEVGSAMVGRPDGRDPLTHAAHGAALLAGAHVVRVHDVRGARQAADAADAVLAAAGAPSAAAGT